MPLPGNQPGNYVPPVANANILVTSGTTATWGVGPLYQVGAQAYQAGEGVNDAPVSTLTWYGSPAISIYGPSDGVRYRIVFAANGMDLLETGSLADAQVQATRLVLEIFGGQYLPSAGTIVNDGGVAYASSTVGWPTSPAQMPAGGMYLNGTTVCIVMPTSPPVTAAPLYWGVISASQLLGLGGANLPLIPPAAGSNQYYNSGGLLCIA